MPAKPPLAGRFPFDRARIQPLKARIPGIVKAMTRRRILTAVLTASIALASYGDFSAPRPRAQGPTPFEAKANHALKRVRESFRLRAGKGLKSSYPNSERTQLARLHGVEEAGNSPTIGVLVTLDRPGAAAELERQGFRPRAVAGRIAVLTARVEEFDRLSAIGSVRRMEAAEALYPLENRTPQAGAFSAQRLRNDAANISVHAPEARSAYGVTGRGVVIGIIDTGVDFRHGDFRKPDGQTRIKFLYDISYGFGNGPGGRGQVYTEAEINAALSGAGTVGERDVDGHGTHVAGTAAGNGLGAGGGTPAGLYAGIAPEADLVVVNAVRVNRPQPTFYSDDVLAGLAFVRDRAKDLGEPWVANLSLGMQGDIYDGTDSFSRAIDSLLEGATGCQVVVAAGNSGLRRVHAAGVMAEGKELEIPFTVTQDNGPLAFTYPASDAISARLVTPEGGTVGPAAPGATVWGDSSAFIEHPLMAWTATTRIVKAQAGLASAGTWKLVITPTRVVDGRWDANATSPNGNGISFDPSVADNLSSVGPPATANRVITVGAYVSKNVSGGLTGPKTYSTGGPSIGMKAGFSSTGPTRDCRLKPEVLAPGQMIMSSKSGDEPADDYADDNSGAKHTFKMGTSMAAPVVTGAVALMLQANPNLPADAIKRLIIGSATNDPVYNPTISQTYGYGRLNALGAVRAALEAASIPELVSISAANYDPTLGAAPEVILAGFGPDLAPRVAQADRLPLPTSLGGVSIRVTDSRGEARLAPLFFVSPTQINYTVPRETALGTALVEVIADLVGLGPPGTGTGPRVAARGRVSVQNVWPGFFTADSSGTGKPSANVLRVKPDNRRIWEPVDAIDLTRPGDRVFLVLYGTGWRGNSGTGGVLITIGGEPVTAAYAGAQSSFAGLDQMNVELPPSLAGRGTLKLVVGVNGWRANAVELTFK